MSTANVEMILDRVDKIADVIRDGAAESERLGHLAPAVIDALHEIDVFRVLIPTELGGQGLTIPETIVILERVASFDASTGWTLAILAGGPLFARSLSREAFAATCDPPGLIGQPESRVGHRRARRGRLPLQRSALPRRQSTCCTTPPG